MTAAGEDPCAQRDDNWSLEHRGVNKTLETDTEKVLWPPQPAIAPWFMYQDCFSSRECKPQTKTQQPVLFIWFTAFHIQAFPMCPVISCETNLPPKMQPTEESKPGLTFPDNKNLCSMGSCCTQLSEIISDVTASSLWFWKSDFGDLL